MTPQEKQNNFKNELLELLRKYKAEMTLQDFGYNYMRDEKIVIAFDYDETLIEENGTKIVTDLILGSYFA